MIYHSEDIPALARHFLKQSADQMGVEPKKLSANAASFLASCKLTGNVRQLENICYWLTVMVAGQTVEVKDMPKDLLEEHGISNPVVQSVAQPVTVTEEKSQSDFAQTSIRQGSSWEKLLEETVSSMLENGDGNLMNSLGAEFERIMIRTALRHTRGRKNEAAVLLGIGRNTIARKIQELGMEDGE